jgi:hypothetical protein
MPARTTQRFGIGEWYGYSYAAADREFRRKCLAQQVKTDEERLLCPFRSREGHPFPCNKKGGVCSLCLYERAPDGTFTPVEGDQGSLRASCPNRFHEDDHVFSWAGEIILGISTPRKVSEVGFLESFRTLDGDEGADVGRIDMILVDEAHLTDYVLPWAALEIQAVYFSGAEMGKEFTAIREDLAAGGDGYVFPTANRHPDYRSSGPKRLMPQLQIKVPTLRRWGKRMAVVVDRSFFSSIGTMSTFDHISNADIAWFIVDFASVDGEPRYTLTKHAVFYTTLEDAVIGLTGGTAVTMPEFERRIREKCGVTA